MWLQGRGRGLRLTGGAGTTWEGGGTAPLWGMEGRCLLGMEETAPSHVQRGNVSPGNGRMLLLLVTEGGQHACPSGAVGDKTLLVTEG